MTNFVGQTRKSGGNAKEGSLLTSLMFDGWGNRMIPSHAVKNGKCYLSWPLFKTAK